LSIGQSYLLVTPLQMACFMASFARGEVHTTPTLIHMPDRPRQRSEPIGLSAENYRSIVQGMEQVTLTGTARILSGKFMQIPGMRIAGKTGTAQKDVYEDGKFKGRINYAWFVGFAPIDRPQVAFTIVVEGDKFGEETGGGTYAVPVAQAILKTWHDKQQKRAAATVASTQ
jgi:penicillin-binding protein 2